jgi:hypothetical protein
VLLTHRSLLRAAGFGDHTCEDRYGIDWAEKAAAILIAMLVAGIVAPQLNPKNVALGVENPLVAMLWVAAIAVPLVFNLWKPSSRRRLWRAIGWCWMLCLLVWIAYPG